MEINISAEEEELLVNLLIKVRLAKNSDAKEKKSITKKESRKLNIENHLSKIGRKKQ